MPSPTSSKKNTTPFPLLKGNQPMTTCLPSESVFFLIPYDQLEGIHSLTAIITEADKYEAEHGNATFVRPVRLPLYDKNIANDATTVVRVRAEAAHKSRLDDNASYKAAERGIVKFLRDVGDEIWYNDLKDAKTFYTKVTAIKIMALLDANSGGLHAVNMISLRTNVMQYYVQVDGIPQFIVMMEDAQKKVKRAGMPIADDELVMMASVAVLAAQHFPRKVDDWEGLLAVNCTWRAWKVAFRLAHLKRQRQLQASGGVNRWVGLTLFYIPHLSPSTAWEQPSTTSLSQLPTTPQSYSSSQRLTWCSLPPMPRSLRPTRNSRRHWLRSRQPCHALPVHLVHLRCPANLFLGITVGLMAIVSASFTRVQHAVTRQRGTRTRQRPPT
jgi:hypothetical protein